MDWSYFTSAFRLWFKFFLHLFLLYQIIDVDRGDREGVRFKKFGHKNKTKHEKGAPLDFLTTPSTNLKRIRPKPQGRPLDFQLPCIYSMYQINKSPIISILSNNFIPDRSPSLWRWPECRRWGLTLRRPAWTRIRSRSSRRELSSVLAGWLSSAGIDSIHFLSKFWSEINYRFWALCTT